jgi:hypothetical protein
MPRAEIFLDEGALALTGSELLTRLRAGSPSIALQPAGKNGVYLNPQTLEPGQERIVVDRIVEVLGH